MPERSRKKPQWGGGVQITAPRLYRVEFVRESEDEIPVTAEGKIGFVMNLTRRAPLRLGIEFGVNVKGVPGLVALALFRMECTLVEGSAEAADADTAFRHACARLAPTVMYPYVREALGSLGMKAQIPNFVLPIVNFGEVYDPAAIEVPAPDGEAPAA